MTEKISDEEINAVLEILEQFGNSEESRLKVKVSEDIKAGTTQKKSHLGRCDVGSPWATGKNFDVLEEFDGKIKLDDAGHLGCE